MHWVSQGRTFRDGERRKLASVSGSRFWANREVQGDVAWRGGGFCYVIFPAGRASRGGKDLRPGKPCHRFDRDLGKNFAFPRRGDDAKREGTWSILRRWTHDRKEGRSREEQREREMVSHRLLGDRSKQVRCLLYSRFSSTVRVSDCLPCKHASLGFSSPQCLNRWVRGNGWFPLLPSKPSLPLAHLSDLRRGIPPSVPAARASVLQDIQKRKCGVERRHACEH